MENNKKQDGKITIKYILSLILCAVITFLITLYIVGLAVVCGPSMQPTMESGDIVVVNKLPKEYIHNDIVIIKLPSKIIIKRVIGVPGDKVLIENGVVYLNGVPIHDVVDFKTEYSGLAQDEICLGNNEYFVLGDNRQNSMDSRFDEIGIIKKDQIIGNVLFTLLPLGSLSK